MIDFAGVTDIKTPRGHLQKITQNSEVLWEKVRYTNWVLKSTDVTGNVYNGMGFRLDLYLSSGNEVAKVGVGCTGFIPAKYNDLLNFKNAGFNINDNYSRICYYDADKNYIGIAKASAFTDNGSTVLINSDTGEVHKVRVSYNSCGFVRVCATGLNGKSVITINEEIT